MKLLYITNTRFPSERAHSTQIAHMCEAFTEAGVNVHLVVNNRTIGSEITPDIFFGFTPSFSFEKIRFGFVFVPYSKIFFVLNNIFFVLYAFLKCSIRKYDKVYFRDEWIGFFLSFLIAPSSMVYESHEAKYSFPARYLLKKGVKCVCISEGIFNYYSEKGVPKGQMLVAHDGIDSSFFNVTVTKKEIRKKLGLDTEKKIAMYIGGFDAWKGIHTFFSASELLKDVEFVAIGGNEKQIQEYNEKYPRVSFLGSSPYKDLKDNQQAADVLVIPNTAKNKLSAEYTSPLKLFAHMTSKVPLVVSDIPSLTSVLSEKTATLFTSDDEVSLSEAIANSFQSEFSQAKANRAYTESLNYTWLKRAQTILPFLT